MDDVTPTDHADVVVVGAGPAGCVLAYLLARSGVDVTLLERHDLRNREFRGYGWQPAAIRLFEEMDLLDAVLELDHDTVRRPTVEVYDDEHEVFDIGEFSSVGYTLLLEQEPLLRLLVARAAEYDGFEFRPHTPVTDLLTEDGRAVGVHARDGETGADVTVRSRLVVAADGRFSTVRAAADIDPGLFDSSLDLVWFKLPREAVDEAAQARIGSGGVLLYFGLGSREAQLGWFVSQGTYPDLRERGIERFRKRLARVDPSLGPYLRDHLRSFEDCSLLHIAPGSSEEWVRDGLALVGDAAHVASPIGAQGNALAVADSVVLHGVVCDAFARHDGDGPLPATALRRFETARRPTVDRTVRSQRRGERVLTTLVRNHPVPDRVRALVVRAALAVGPRLPPVRRTARRFFGDVPDVRVERARFVDT
ncbi:FAD-dependent oxidoreductase [Halomarina oriensis]|uniref:FAD-dependent oxidoreductase n=1 Tax=Halomarina oriensis TaxID=671145 RepID=A0A6B0GSY0_9EURY|nr:FAD-dependent oxidoreductase [Halomarina oriensis]MWG36779.1 FAD-dependent oxidoreductase [Halomarina oriensis]